jgi:hypothetical protein
MENRGRYQHADTRTELARFDFESKIGGRLPVAFIGLWGVRVRRMRGFE